MQHKTFFARTSRLAVLLVFALHWLPGTASTDAIFASGMEEFVWLEGRAGIDVPLAFAEIVQSTGADTTTTQADAEGWFRIRVPHDGDRLVVLRAYGVGAQSHIAFSSMADTARRLRLRAGGDRTLTPSEEPYLNLSAFTTAMQVVIGEPLSEFSDSAAFDAAVLRLQPSMAQGIAVLVFAVSNAGKPLPSLFTNTLEMVESGANARSAANELLLISSTEYDQLAHDTRAEFDGADFSALPTFQSVLPVFAEPLNAAGYPLFVIQENGGARVSASWHAGASATWTVDASVWRFQADSADGFSQYGRSTGANIPDDDPDLGYITVWQTCKVDQYELLLSSAPAGGLLASPRQHHRCITPDYPSLGEQAFWTRPAGPMPALIDRMPGKAFNNVAGRSLLLPGQTGVGYTNDYIPDDPDNHFFLDIHRFVADGTGHQERLGRDFRWNLDSVGRLEIQYSDGTEASIIVSATMGDHDVGHISTLLPDGRSFQTRGPIIETIAGPSAFPSIEGELSLYPQSQYASSFYLYSELANYERPLLFRLNSNGSGFRSSSVLNWTFDAGQLRLDVLHDPVPHVNGVPHPIRQRLGWELVLQRENIIYLLVNRSGTTLTADAPGIDFGRPAVSLVKYRMESAETR